MTHTAIQAAWTATREHFANGGRAFRKSVVWRCHEAMGPERALMLRDSLKTRTITPKIGHPFTLPGMTLKEAIKDQRSAGATGHWSFKPERLRELLAARLWELKIARRDREFFSRRSAA
jgi:hypothetical protein